VPDKPTFDHRFFGLIHGAIREAPPRVVEDYTRQIEHPRFREIASGRIYELVLRQQAATTRPAPAAAEPKPGEPTAVDRVIAAVWDAFADADPGLIKDVECDGTTVMFAAADGTEYAVAAEEVTEQGAPNPGSGKAPAPAQPATTAPASDPTAPQTTPGTAPA
jgi:hypothetical protein